MFFPPALLYYYATFLLSCALTLFFVWRWHKHFDIFFVTIFTLVPIINLGYLLLASASSLEGALTANKITYLGGCFLQPVFTLCIFSLCKIKLRRRYVLSLFLLEWFIYICVLTTENNSLFYKNTSLSFKYGVSILQKEYGPVHSLFYALLILLLLISFFVLLHSYRKKLASRRIIFLFLLNNIITVGALFLARATHTVIELLPSSYVLNLAVFLVIIDRICLYNVDETVIDGLTQNADIGWISLDTKRHFLGYNKAAYQFFPELQDLNIDEKLNTRTEASALIISWIEQVEQHRERQDFFITKDSINYRVTVDYLYEHQVVRGYRIKICDITQEQQYNNLLNNYNAVLDQMEKEKAAHVLAMQDKLTLGMAEMIESRDPSTGEHIKRTSHIIRILIDEMKKDTALNLDQAFCDCVIKAAPMHDIGKIAMEDAILRKPGKLTYEEYEIMKTHVTKGADIVRQLLDGIDAPYFAQVAENVARYHHERFDGLGYPDGLAGASIPLEARIMAIVDEYDALVSKRCYKDSMSFDEVFRIIEEGMGTQFDPALHKYFVNCRKQFEEYYKEVE